MFLFHEYVLQGTQQAMASDYVHLYGDYYSNPLLLPQQDYHWAIEALEGRVLAARMLRTRSEIT
jgi:hypothetical protein